MYCVCYFAYTWSYYYLFIINFIIYQWMIINKHLCFRFYQLPTIQNYKCLEKYFHCEFVILHTLRILFFQLTFFNKNK